jgi:hypothetical protein
MAALQSPHTRQFGRISWAAQQKSCGGPLKFTTLFVTSIYDDCIDIDSTYCFDIIRRHLANQATSADTAETAGCDLS